MSKVHFSEELSGFIGQHGDNGRGTVAVAFKVEADGTKRYGFASEAGLQGAEVQNMTIADVLAIQAAQDNAPRGRYRI